MKKESLRDIKVLLGLYQELVNQWDKAREPWEDPLDAFEFIGEDSYFSRFFESQNTIGDYDRRPSIDRAILELCKFEQLVLNTEKTYNNRR